MPKCSTWAEWWRMSWGAVVIDGILWKIVGDLWLLNNFVASPFLFWSLPTLSSCGLYRIPLCIHDVHKYPLGCCFHGLCPRGRALGFRHLSEETCFLWSLSEVLTLHVSRGDWTFTESFPIELPKFSLPPCIMEIAECSILGTITVIDGGWKNY